MSLEKAVEELAEAVRENNELLRGMTAKAKAATGGTTSKAKDEDGETKPKTTRASKPKAVSSKEISDKTKEFLDVSDDDEYEERKLIVKKIVKKYGVEKVSEIESADDRTEAMALLLIAIAGDDPFPKRSRDDDV